MQFNLNEKKGRVVAGDIATGGRVRILLHLFCLFFTSIAVPAIATIAITPTAT